MSEKAPENVEGTQEYLILPKTKGPLRWTTAALLALLVIGTILIVGTAAFLILRDIENEQTAEIAKNRAIIEQMDREQDEAVILAGRTQTLELASTRSQLRLLLCTLDPRGRDCSEVEANAEKIDTAIEDLEQDIHRHIVHVQTQPPPAAEPAPAPEPQPEPQPEPEPSPQPSPSPSPAPSPPPPAPSPHVGNSDQCPPKNPFCQ